MVNQKQNKQAEINFFNRFGFSCNDFDALDEHGYQRLIREFLRALPRRPGLKIADLGCGTGVFTKRLYDKGYCNIVGIDITPQVIKLAKEKYPTVRFEVEDIENLAYPDETFDAISLFGVIHHFPDLSSILKICQRLLRKRGILFTYDPHMNNPFNYIYHNPKSPFYTSATLTENERMLRKKEVRNALVSAGFQNYKVYCVSGVTLNTKCKKYSNLVEIFSPLYNFSEYLIDFFSFRNLIGSSLISISYKN